ncbi:nucleoside-diphosphate kinase [Streptomyces cellostaticus]|uniref:nucleoside-diphosphate kinase n=1 Tax=Streptomyces cellostaticus TaxID=67285 RepID=UPI0020262BF7|nr:nucleoside-diphosphate kinase [Streptomyces cellostaticus]
MNDQNSALLMVKPDGVHQGLTAAVLAFLRARGFEAHCIRRMHLTPAARSALYATTRSTGQLDWDLNGVLYTLGPVDAVLLTARDFPPDHGSAAAHVSRDLKGHFVPTRSAPGTLRGELNAMNPIFNLVHTSDDPEECSREARVLFGEDWRSLLGPRSATAASGTAVAAPHARLLDHWATLATTLGPLLAAAPRQGLALLYEFGWPASQTPDAAPQDRHRQYQAAHNTLTGLATALRSGHVSEIHPLLPELLPGGVRFPTLAEFLRQAQTRQPGLSAWDAYLTYTTLRYLDLCLEELL